MARQIQRVDYGRLLSSFRFSPILHQSAGVQLVLKAFLCLCTDRYEDFRVLIPLGNSAVIGPSVLVVDDEGHGAMAQAFLEHNQPTHAAVSVFEGKDLFEPHMEVQDLIPLDFGLVLIIPDQRCQTGIDSAHRQQLPIPGTGSHSPVLTRADLLTVGIHRGFQETGTIDHDELVAVLKL